MQLAQSRRYGTDAIDIDVLEACFVLGVSVDDPVPGFSVTFAGWLYANTDHPFRNQDIVESGKDTALQGRDIRGAGEAIACRGGSMQQGYRQANLEQRAFPLAAGDRPGIKEMWRQHTSDVLARLEGAGLASFEAAHASLETMLWPEGLRLFPELAAQSERNRSDCRAAAHASCRRL